MNYPTMTRVPSDYYSLQGYNSCRSCSYTLPLEPLFFIFELCAVRLLDGFANMSAPTSSERVLFRIAVWDSGVGVLTLACPLENRVELMRDPSAL